jgi:enoyl-[acyl-carrier-protein] reductase (NADH)
MPGYKTKLGRRQEHVDQFVNSSVSNLPPGRPDITDKIAQAVLFLASDDSSGVNGIELFVNSGSTQV